MNQALAFNPKVDELLAKAKHWQRELQALRELALACDLVEEIKWGQACYTLNNANVVLIHGFKDYCALAFFKGALLQDPESLLIQQTENVQATRQLRFTSLEQIQQQAAVITTYIHAAIAVETAGLNVTLKATEDFSVPAEFQSLQDNNAQLKAAFAALTPGRQRGYLLYFAGAKQAKTRLARIEKFIPRIFAGLGLHD